jgi:hypothetical protein
MGNDMWELVRSRAGYTRVLWRAAGLRVEFVVDRDPHDVAARFSWTITSPGTVRFVRDHCGPRVVDPLAGTGWWAFLLGRIGVDVVASDVAPSDQRDESSYRHPTWVPVVQANGAERTTAYGRDRTLLLGWPPIDSQVGRDVLAAYTGNRVIYMGESRGGCCGTSDLFEVLDERWKQVADHLPVRWHGYTDLVRVFERKSVI